jgi:hypothetical protein
MVTVRKKVEFAIRFETFKMHDRSAIGHGPAISCLSIHTRVELLTVVPGYGSLNRNASSRDDMKTRQQGCKNRR